MMSFHKEETSSEEEQAKTNSLYSTDMVITAWLNRAVFLLISIFVTQMLSKGGHLIYKKGVHGKMRWWEIIQTGLYS